MNNNSLIEGIDYRIVTFTNGGGVIYMTDKGIEINRRQRESFRKLFKELCEEKEPEKSGTTNLRRK